MLEEKLSALRSMMVSQEDLDVWTGEKCTRACRRTMHACVHDVHINICACLRWHKDAWAYRLRERVRVQIVCKEDCQTSGLVIVVE